MADLSCQRLLFVEYAVDADPAFMSDTRSSF